jgi:hypothetical protein
MSPRGRLCCKTLFVSPNTDFPGRGCGKRILMWGTTSFCDELTDDFGDAFEATPIDDCRLFCRLAEILPHGVLGLLQHNRPDADLAQRQLLCRYLFGVERTHCARHELFRV